LIIFMKESFYGSGKKNRGFTLIELLIVLAIGAMAVGSLALFGNQFVTTQELERAVELTKNELKAAQADSISGTSDTVWGVAIFSNYIVRFQGESFNDRIQAFDLITDFSNALLISSGQEEMSREIIFHRLSGVPENPAEITFTLNNKTKMISVNSQGLISNE